MSPFCYLVYFQYIIAVQINEGIIVSIESFKEAIKGHYLLTVQITLIVILTVLGLFTLSELSERERLLTYYRVQLDNVEQKILSNFQVALSDETIQEKNQDPVDLNTAKSGFVLVKIPSSLVAERKKLDKNYTELEERIIQGNSNEKSTNVLMASLILLATLTGSLVQSLREIDGNDKQEREDKLSDFLIRISSGLGAGIVCALFLTSNGWSSTESLGVFPSLGPSMKTLIGFLVGMFSKDLYELLADSVPALFKFVRSKIPGITP